MKIPKYFLEEDGVRKKSQRQESRVASTMGGRVQKGSGAVRLYKGDIKTPELLIEAKRTDKGSLSVKREWLEKISKEAESYGKVPALSIEFADMPKLVEKDWVAIPASFLKRLMDVFAEMVVLNDR